MKITRLFLISFSLVFWAFSTSSQTNDIQTDNNKERKNSMGFLFGIDGSLNFQNLSSANISSSSQISSAMGTSIIPSLGVRYMFTPTLGVGTGVRFGNYKPGFSFNNFSEQLELELTDIDDDRYNPIFENTNLEEVSSINSLDIPIFFTYMLNLNKLNFLVDAGVQYSSLISMQYSLDGSYERKGYYPDYKVVLHSLPEYSYGEFEFDGKEQFELTPSGSTISAYFALGVITEIKSNIYAKVNVGGSFGLTSVSPDLSSNSTTFYSSAYLGDVFLRNYFLELGIYYRLKK